MPRSWDRWEPFRERMTSRRDCRAVQNLYRSRWHFATIHSRRTVMISLPPLSEIQTSTKTSQHSPSSLNAIFHRRIYRHVHGSRDEAACKHAYHDVGAWCKQLPGDICDAQGSGRLLSVKCPTTVLCGCENAPYGWWHGSFSVGESQAVSARSWVRVLMYF